MELIFVSRPSDDNPKRHMFLLKWNDFSQEDNTWETYENVAEYDMELLKDYYARNRTVESDGRFCKQKGTKKLIRKKVRT